MSCKGLLGDGKEIDIEYNKYGRLHYDGRRLIQGWFLKAENLYSKDKNIFESFIFFMVII